MEEALVGGKSCMFSRCICPNVFRNGGFGLVLDGSEDAERRARSMLDWDVNNGIARRAWAGNSNARFAIQRAQESNSSLKVTMANPVSSQVLNQIVKEYKPKV